jgi:uncharacterized protein YutE (UPF0331/DUF86 family)
MTLRYLPEHAEPVRLALGLATKEASHLQYSRTLLDTLAFAEKANLLSNAEDFIAARRLRNALVHEYMHDAQVFLESLFQAQTACDMFLDIIRQIEAELQSRAVP